MFETSPKRPSAIHELLEMLGVAVTVNCDGRQGALDVREIVGSQLHGGRRDVLLESRLFGRAGNRRHPRFLRKNPCERDLGGRRAFVGRDAPQRIHEGEVRLACCGVEPWNQPSKIVGAELGFFVDGTGQKSLCPVD